MRGASLPAPKTDESVIDERAHPDRAVCRAGAFASWRSNDSAIFALGVLITTFHRAAPARCGAFAMSGVVLRRGRTRNAHSFTLAVRLLSIDCHVRVNHVAHGYRRWDRQSN
jgi:hypothetical protein